MSSQYEVDVAAVQQFEREAEQARLNLYGWREVSKMYPAIENCEANYQALVAYFAPGVIDVNGVTQALQPAASNLIERLSIRSEQKAREDFAEQIASGAGDPAFVKAQLLKNWGHASQSPVYTTETLQSKAEQARQNREARGLHVHELKTILKDSRTDYGTFPPLPAEYTAERMKRRDFSPSLLRQLIRVHSAQAVTDRLSGKH